MNCACGLALLAPALLNPRSARAATVVVDQFATDQAALWAYPDPSISLPRDSSSSVSVAGILGGERDIRVRANIADIDNPSNTMWALVNNGIFESHRQLQVTGTNEIQWDGPDGDGASLDHTGLDGVDLTGGGRPASQENWSSLVVRLLFVVLNRSSAVRFPPCSTAACSAPPALSPPPWP